MICGLWRLRLLIVAAGLVALATACADPGDVSSDSTTVATSTTTSLVTAVSTTLVETNTSTVQMEPVDLSLILSDPVALVMTELEYEHPELGTLITLEEIDKAHECVTSQLFEELDWDDSLLVASDNSEFYTLAVDLMSEDERDALSRIAAACDEDAAMLRRLIAVEDLQVADCIAQKTQKVDRVEELLGELALGTDVQTTNIVVGYRYSCQAEVLEIMFPPPDVPEASAGDDLRNVGTWISEALYPTEQLSVFEKSCILRGTQRAIGIEWAWTYLRRDEQHRSIYAIDYLLTVTNEQERSRIFDDLRSTLISCVDPFKLLVSGSDINLLPPESIGCVRDGLSDEQMRPILEFQFAQTDLDETSLEYKQAQIPIRSALENCGLVRS